MNQKDLLNCALIALEQLAVRFPIEFGTSLEPLKCKCLQFEDHGDACRHIYAFEVIELAMDDGYVPSIVDMKTVRNPSKKIPKPKTENKP